MTQDVGATLQALLAKLEKLDSIESAVKKIEANLENLEKRTQRLEDFQTTGKKDIDELKEGMNFTGQQLKDKTEAVEKAHRLHETQLAELMIKCRKNEDLLDEIHTKNLYFKGQAWLSWLVRGFRSKRSLVRFSVTSTSVSTFL